MPDLETKKGTNTMTVLNTRVEEDVKVPEGVVGGGGSDVLVVVGVDV